ncbi:MAG: PQQ-binding-like beta-propeller repeat protein [Acidobacteria bacterium]|nr:PQQ-binding-like beta-propeller repeat protein [Acidobacteriota bacterium]
MYAVDAASGELIWKMRADDQTVSRITGAPQLYKGRLYVPVSMPEDGLANNPKYECCRLRSNVVAVDAETGKQIWKTYTVSEEPKPQGKMQSASNFGGHPEQASGPRRPSIPN